MSVAHTVTMSDKNHAFNEGILGSGAHLSVRGVSDVLYGTWYTVLITFLLLMECLR